MKNYILYYAARCVRKISIFIRQHQDIQDVNGQGGQYQKYVELFDQEANNYILDLLKTGAPCLIAKFGTYELAALEEYRCLYDSKLNLNSYIDYALLRRNVMFKERNAIEKLCSNAGFFPDNKELLKEYYRENLEAIKQIDVLGSYQSSEYVFREELSKAKKVNLDGYYAPFIWDLPWTSILKGKRVLVVHPFSEEIKYQYERRASLWDNPDILPEFTLITYKSVQSMLGIQTQYASWFEALERMKQDIDLIDYDIALIGCGAYGMPLAAHCKKTGRQAIHLAGWTQVLFGIIGTRWENNPKISPFIKDSWIRPFETSKPAEAHKIENSCYW